MHLCWDRVMAEMTTSVVQTDTAVLEADFGKYAQVLMLCSQEATTSNLCSTGLFDHGQTQLCSHGPVRPAVDAAPNRRTLVQQTSMYFHSLQRVPCLFVFLFFICCFFFFCPASACASGDGLEERWLFRDHDNNSNDNHHHYTHHARGYFPCHEVLLASFVS